ncbi:MAG: hypothetical protein JWM19_4887 [Actinomycetia bacterium]|nr:hypothetical protein [Actinomycetes bacterium]
MGAPLIDVTGTVLGTVCVVDVEQRLWGRDALALRCRVARPAVCIVIRPGSRWSITAMPGCQSAGKT